MARVSGSIPNIVNGVSQQPAALRLPTQGEEQRNCYSTVVKGLQKRPPMVHVAKLSTSMTSSTKKVHIINRSPTEQYVAILGEDAELEIYDFSGVLQTLTADDYTNNNIVGAVATGAGSSVRIWPSPTDGAIDFTVTIPGTATVTLEESTTGAFAGEETTVATRTTTGTTTINRTGAARGRYYRANVTAWTSGATNADITWENFNYLQCTDAETDMRALTVADYTFLVNTTMTVAKATALSATRNPEALCFVKSANYGMTYTIDIDNGTHTFSYKTPNGSVATHVDDLNTEKIAQVLYDMMTAGSTSSAGAGTASGSGALGGSWTVALNRSTLYLVNTAGTDFVLKCSDSRGGSSFAQLKDKTASFTDLPYYGYTGFEVEITGDSSAVDDNYYVRSESDTTGVWAECVKQGVEYALDAQTMPVALVSTGTAFNLTRPAWTDRGAGDDNTVPFPSLVGNTINDVFFYKNRLGFLSDENIIMSAAADFFRFFKKTAQALLDDDPIDIGASHVKVSILKSAIPYNETLILFSDQTQFKLQSGDILTPKNAALTPTTEFESSTNARPVGAGTFIYFTVEKENFTSIREYYIKDNTEDNDARDITAHVPEYIPAGVTLLAASTNEDCLVAYAPTQVNKLYIYKYYWDGGDKLQSSWSYWDFPDVTKIKGFSFVQSQLFTVVDRADGTFLEKINFEQGVTQDDSLGYRVHLDRKIWLSNSAVSAAYDAGTDQTTFTFSTITWKSVPKVCISSGGSEDPGWLVPIVGLPTTYDANTIVVSGDLTAENIIFGLPYTSQYDMSTIFIRENATGGGVTVNLEGRLVLQSIKLEFDATAYFRAEVTPRGRPQRDFVFNGSLLEEVTTVVGALSLATGKFRFPVRTRNDRATISIVNDTPWPMNLISFEWEGQYTTKARKVS